MISSCVRLLVVRARLSITGWVVMFFSTDIEVLPLATALNICLSIKGNRIRAKANFLRTPV